MTYLGIIGGWLGSDGGITMATLTVDVIKGGLNTATGNYSGVVPAAKVAAAAGGDQFYNDGRTFFEVNKSSGTSVVTFVRQNPNSDGIKENAAVSVTAETRRFGPFATSLFNDGNGYVQVTYDTAANLTVGAVRLAEMLAG